MAQITVSVRLFIFIVHVEQKKKNHLEYNMHEIHGGSDLRLNDSYVIILSSVGQRLMFVLS